MSESRAVESCGESYAAAELNKCAFQTVRTLFSVGLNMFYNHVEVAGSHYVPSKNQPTILFANHSNSLTDAITLLSCTPRIVRFTAKDTLWRSPWFSVFVKGAGTVPIMRRKDHSGQPVSNHRAFKALREVLGQGGCVCMFPEGISRYNPSLAPLKPGVAGIAIDTVLQNEDVDDFVVRLLPCGIVYVHREKFRSNVLVQYGAALEISLESLAALRDIPRDFPNIAAHIGITSTESPSSVRQRTVRATASTAYTEHQKRHMAKAITCAMEFSLRRVILNSPTWSHSRLALCAARLYAPYGTRLGLCQYLRLIQHFVDVFCGVTFIDYGDKNPAALERQHGSATFSSGSGAGVDVRNVLRVVDDHLKQVDASSHSATRSPLASPSLSEQKKSDGGALAQLTDTKAALKHYQDWLDEHGLKDYRVLTSDMSSCTVLWRIVLRLVLLALFTAVSLPGLLLWLPVFVAARWQERQIVKKGVHDNLDEVSQYKLSIGCVILLLEWMLVLLLTLPICFITFWLFPLLVWLTVRWLEDGFSSARSIRSLAYLLTHSAIMFHQKREERRVLCEAVTKLGKTTGLPPASQLIQVRNQTWRQRALSSCYDALRFCSLQRRRTKDWNEALRLYDVTSGYNVDANLPLH